MTLTRGHGSRGPAAGRGFDTLKGYPPTMCLAMREHRNVEAIQETYDAFAAGDLTKALRNLAPAGVFHFGGTGPLSGDRMGVTYIKEALVGAYALSGGTRHFEIEHIYADDRHGVVLLRERASRPDGMSIDLLEAHVIEYDDLGRITDLWDIPDDPDAHNRFFDKDMGPRPTARPLSNTPMCARSARPMTHW